MREVEAHAVAAGWPPLVQNIGDEPAGVAINESLASSQVTLAYHLCCPQF